MTDKPIASLVWPACPDDPAARTALTVADLVNGGGGEAMRRYVADGFSRAANGDPSTPGEWVQSSLDHLRAFAGDHTDGGVQVSAAALQLALAYIDYLEEARHG